MVKQVYVGCTVAPFRRTGHENLTGEAPPATERGAPLGSNKVRNSERSLLTSSPNPIRAPSESRVRRETLGFFMRENSGLRRPSPKALTHLWFVLLTQHAMSQFAEFTVQEVITSQKRKYRNTTML